MSQSAIIWLIWFWVSMNRFMVCCYMRSKPVQHGCLLTQSGNLATAVNQSNLQDTLKKNFCYENKFTWHSLYMQLSQEYLQGDCKKKKSRTHMHTNRFYNLIIKWTHKGGGNCCIDYIIAPLQICTLQLRKRKKITTPIICWHIFLIRLLDFCSIITQE